MTLRFENTFNALKARNEGGFVPFVTVCDPDFETSVKIIKTLIDNGADALELGFPFSDPCADGPVIQHADKRALASGAKTSDFFKLIKEIRSTNDNIPISILVYANVVVAHGIETFYRLASENGIDAVLVPDVPVNMLCTQEDFLKCAKKYNVNTVLIAPPNASEETLQQISKVSTGYTYVLSRFGITGTENIFGKPQKVISRIKELGGAAPIIGFGISTPEHVKEALKIGAVGAIAGSACEKIIEQNLSCPEIMLNKLGEYVRKMKQATKL